MKKCGFCQYKYKRLKTAKTCGKDENRMNIFSGIFRSRDKPTDRTAGSSYSFFLGNSSAGKYVTERSAMQMTDWNTRRSYDFGSWNLLSVKREKRFRIKEDIRY